MSFEEYNVQDFLHHELFRKWVISPDHDTDLFWKEWLTANPDKQEIVDQARHVLLIIGFEEHEPTPADQQEVWEKITTTIHRSKRFVIPHWWRYAAVFLGILITTAIIYNNGEEIRYSTEYGEMKTIILPDRSVVRLNAHSTLRYRHRWLGKYSREVWFDGEGYFSVMHDRNNQQFLVHTTDVNVQVIGTAFNVNTRRVKTQVVLNNGVVRLKLNRSTREMITMKPGDMITYSASTDALVNERVNPQDYSAWLNNTLVFNNTPIKDVIITLEDNLGIHINIDNAGLEKETFTGSIPMDNASIFFKTLLRSFKVKISVDDDKQNYIISRK
jgi:ferric-dicitrate binding protein FerR (iron transport regulator)